MRYAANPAKNEWVVSLRIPFNGSSMISSSLTARPSIKGVWKEITVGKPWMVW